MKKSGLLSSLETLRIQSETMEVTEDRNAIVSLRLIDILLDYIGDKEIREAADEVVL